MFNTETQRHEGTEVFGVWGIAPTLSNSVSLSLCASVLKKTKVSLCASVLKKTKAGGLP